MAWRNRDPERDPVEAHVVDPLANRGRGLHRHDLRRDHAKIML